MRLVLDTNTALSGLIWQGIPGAVLDAALARRIQLISSIPLLAELEGVLSRPKFQQVISQRGVNPADLFDGYVALVECVIPVTLEVPVSRDPDDDQILIVSARDALSRLEQAGR